MRHKILVVDDYREVRDLIVTYLERRGYEVSSAANVDDALAQFERNTPDPLLTDLTMPGKNGIQLSTAVRRSSSVPIVVMSANGAGWRSRVFESGANAFVSKPFDWAEFLAKIEALLKMDPGRTTALSRPQSESTGDSDSSGDPRSSPQSTTPRAPDPGSSDGGRTA